MTPDEPSDTSDEQSGPASVADEAMRLAEAFAVWAQNSKLAAEATVDDSARDDATADTAPVPERHRSTAGCDCAQGTAVEAVCRMCPVCRLAGVVQAVQPDLLDRVADLLGVVAGGLHTAAQQRRTADAPTKDERDTSGAVDVPVTGEDDD